MTRNSEMLSDRDVDWKTGCMSVQAVLSALAPIIVGNHRYRPLGAGRHVAKLGELLQHRILCFMEGWGRDNTPRGPRASTNNFCCLCVLLVLSP